MKKLFAVLTILLSTVISKGVMADVSANNLRDKTSTTTIDKIGNGGATCITNKMTNEEATEALATIQNHMQDISPEEREIVREKIITILNDLEN
jgi:hypothetical protein